MLGVDRITFDVDVSARRLTKAVLDFAWGYGPGEFDFRSNVVDDFCLAFEVVHTELRRICTIEIHDLDGHSRLRLVRPWPANDEDVGHYFQIHPDFPNAGVSRSTAMRDIYRQREEEYDRLVKLLFEILRREGIEPVPGHRGQQDGHDPNASSASATGLLSAPVRGRAGGDAVDDSELLHDSAGSTNPMGLQLQENQEQAATLGTPATKFSHVLHLPWRISELVRWGQDYREDNNSDLMVFHSPAKGSIDIYDSSFGSVSLHCENPVNGAIELVPIIQEDATPSSVAELQRWCDALEAAAGQRLALAATTDPTHDLTYPERRIKRVYDQIVAEGQLHPTDEVIAARLPLGRKGQPYARETVNRYRVKMRKRGIEV